MKQIPIRSSPAKTAATMMIINRSRKGDATAAVREKHKGRKIRSWIDYSIQSAFNIFPYWSKIKGE